jgi:hypothetical protein
MAARVQIVGSVLVRNEDVFVERAIRNIAAACDRIHAVDHMSEDRTWEILRGLAVEFDHLDVRRSRHAADSHRVLEPYAGTRTWVLGVDGDELFDPGALARLREALLAGEHADMFRLKGHVLNCDELDGGRASGYMAPPSRPITKVFNFAAVSAWSGSSQRLHDGEPVFQPGYDMGSLRYLSESTDWEGDPLRCLHVCFLRRSTRDRGVGIGRKNLNESREHDRGVVGVLKRKVRTPWVPPKVAELHRAGTNWKRSWYARGDRMTVDAKPFLGGPF